MLKVFNDLTNQMEEFQPLNPPNVLMYVCGPTVYDVPHLGHARSEVAFDMIRKYLEYKGFSVKYVHNYTDIDDKMIVRANQEEIDIYTLAERNIKAYERMQEALFVKEPTVKPRATEEIEPIIKLIQKLEENNYIYESGGSIYFDTAKMDSYNSLFRTKKKKIKENNEENDPEELDDTEAFTQSNYVDEKRNIEDFVLWKKKKEGEPFFESPWGEGRPGWHIECSAMSMKYLGDSIDIHGGGKDLKNPHHQNEIAQSECANGQLFSKYWLHNGFLNIDNTKMSKSLGNFIPLEELLEKYSGEVIRYFFLNSYYQRPMNFSTDKLDQAQQSYKRIQKFYYKLKNYSNILEKNQIDENKSKEVSTERFKVSNYQEQLADDNLKFFFKALDDDFNTAKAIGYLFTLINDFSKQVLNKNLPILKNVKKKILAFMDQTHSFLGFTSFPPELVIENEDLDISESDSLWKKKYKELVEKFLNYRKELKESKQYDSADMIRNKMNELGISIVDTGSEFEWSIKKVDKKGTKK
jgi:cysteinyl-tRNA synthetase